MEILTLASEIIEHVLKSTLSPDKKIAALNIAKEVLSVQPEQSNP